MITSLANNELNGPRGEGYRRILAQLPMGCAATPDEVGELLLTHAKAFYLFRENKWQRKEHSELVQYVAILLRFQKRNRKAK